MTSTSGEIRVCHIHVITVLILLKLGDGSL